MTEYIILTRSGLGLLNADTGARHAGARASARARPRFKVETADLKAKEAADLAGRSDKTLARRFRTKLVQPTSRKKAAAARAWGVEAIGAGASKMDGEGVVVAVLDTGIAADHPAFAGMSRKIAQEDFSGDGNGDVDGHGTHCAGTIFGQDIGRTRIGIARNIKKALIGKVLGDDGAGDTAMLINGMMWAHKNGANVISMSLGFDFAGEIQQAIDEGWPADIAGSAVLEAYGANLRVFDAVLQLIHAATPLAEEGGGCIVVAATGNESRRGENAKWIVNASVPAAADGVISVGAVRNGARGYAVADFSNSQPKLVAPGVDILSANLDGGLVAWDGTSMAAPHVAGAAALWWQHLRANSFATPEAVRARLLAKASDARLRVSDSFALRGAGMVSCPP